MPIGIGVTKAPDGEYIGISDGTFAFDTNRPDGQFKTQAADKLKAGDASGAESLWQSGLAADTNDAEAFIYLEDQRVLASGNPYITLVVGTFITGEAVDLGRYDLQGAYIAQREFNNGHKLSNNLQLRLLIANSGNVATYATSVAQHIVQAAEVDHTIVGVMGWPYSSHTFEALGVLAKAHIPIVSPEASSDQLTGISPTYSVWFHRIKCKPLRPHNMPNESCMPETWRSSSILPIPTAARSPLISVNSSLLMGITLWSPRTTRLDLRGELSCKCFCKMRELHNPDLIYFSGYYTDISSILEYLPTKGPYASLLVLSGDGQCEVGGYTCSAGANFTRLRFTKFAYADEWDYAGLKAKKPAFFNEYISAYNPNGQQPAGRYGYTRPTGDAMLSYDATLALLMASKIALKTSKSSLTPNDVLQGLRQITGANTLQGVSGPIAFASNGDPINKPLVVLAVDY